MIAKILVIAAFLVLLMFVLLPRHGSRRTRPAAASRPGRAFAVLCLAAVLLLVAAALCAAFWMGTMAAGESGSAVLLRIAAVLFALSAACGLAAFLKRP